MADELWMQDWPLEVADPARVAEFIQLYEGSTDDEGRFALMELILYSLDQMLDAGRAEWARVEELLEVNGALHAYLVIYWSCVEETLDGSWAFSGEDDELFGITPLARRVLANQREAYGFLELVLSPASSAR